MCRSVTNPIVAKYVPDSQGSKTDRSAKNIGDEQAEYKKVMKKNPSRFSGKNLPVETVSWLDAVKYCNARSKNEGFTPVYKISGKKVTWNRKANGYRLPTEAEWEYACRAGTVTPFNTENSISAKEANYYGHYPYGIEENYFTEEKLETKPGVYREKTVSVKSFSPNAWGLYNMHGNVSEWVWDYYGTYTIAEYIAESIDADVYRIEPAVPYTSADLNYGNADSRTSKEQNDMAARLEIAGELPVLDGYENVYTSYSIWWGQAPKILYTFVENCNLSGKTVIPSCTSASSGIGTSAANLQAADTSQATWLTGQRFSVSSSKSDVESWILGLGLQ